jgi:hypothetical protein
MHSLEFGQIASQARNDLKEEQREKRRSRFSLGFTTVIASAAKQSAIPNENVIDKISEL